MNVKYRIRLRNDRVVGPFSADEIGELYLKKHIDGSEMCQQFPIGNWQTLSQFQQLQDKFNKLADPLSSSSSYSGSSDDSKGKDYITKTSFKNKKAVKTSGADKEIKKGDDPKTKSIAYAEFHYERENKLDVNYDELERKYRELNPGADDESDGMEKTIVLKKSPPKRIDLDKTFVIRRKDESQKSEEELRSDIKKYFKPASDLIEPVEEVPTKEELINEKTEFMNLAHALPSINAQLSVSEVELENKAKIEANQERMRLRELHEIMLKEQTLEEGAEDAEVEVVDEFISDKKGYLQKITVKKKKKSLSVIFILAFLAITYMFLQEEEKPRETGPLFLEVKFPITEPVENEAVSNKALADARLLYSKGTYKARSLASGLYLTSLRHKFSNNEALGEILLTYSELLNNSREKKIAANTVYKFVQLAESKILTSHTVATGVAHFYFQIGKYQTGIYIVKNYLRAGNKPTPKLLGYYLGLLVSGGDLIEARKVYETLKNIPQKPFEAYLELARFSLSDDKLLEAKQVIEEGLKNYPNSVPLLLKKAEIVFKEQSIKEYESILKLIKKNDSENSPVYLASYLQDMGYLSAYKNQNKEAAQYFKKSLEIIESEDLRLMLSKLEIGGDKLSQTLILESKVLDLIKKAKEEYKAQNLDSAFQYAIEAIDAAPDFPPAVIFHSEINMERGYFESAINSLQRMLSIQQQNYLVKTKLIQAYIRSFKFDEAERALAELAQTKFATSPEFASLMGEFAEAKKNLILAIKWYGKALARDPLRDENMFQIARILVRNKRFSEARQRIAKALLLDPKNSKYHALYSEILYDQDGTDTAIGYLRDTISEIGEDPILISSITALYFKSGQIKEFQTYYQKVQDMPKKNEGFYEVLINAAKLENRKDEYIKHSLDLLKLNPGNLKVRMSLGELFLEDKKYDEAVVQFNEIKDKLASYPKVHFYLARVYIATNKLPLAKEMAQKELDLNPNLDSAHFIMGEVHRLTKDYREAVIKYEKAISLNPKSVDALVSMASLRLSQNYANEAIELLTRALREDISNPLIYKIMGDAYRAAGQRALSREKYEEYLKLNPVAPDKDQIETHIKNLK